MSGAEVFAIVGCVAAVVSAFHGGAELTELIKDRRAVKKRRRLDREKEREEMRHVAQHEILRDSLTDGERQVEINSFERRQSFGAAFERGDDIAERELMRVVISLQGEVIRALQLARDAEQVALNLNRLYEFSITNRRDALGSMDQLCQRILQNHGPRRLPSINEGGVDGLAASVARFNFHDRSRTASDDSLASFRTASADLPSAVILTSNSNGPISSFSNATRGWAPTPANPVNRQPSNASFTRSFAWIGRHVRRDDDDAMSVRTQRIQEVEEPQQSYGRAVNLSHNTFGAQQGPQHPDATMTPPQTSVEVSFPPAPMHYRLPSSPAALPKHDQYPEYPLSGDRTSKSSSSSQQITVSRMDSEPGPVLNRLSIRPSIDESTRASSAPEVVTIENTPGLSRGSSVSTSLYNSPSTPLAMSAPDALHQYPVFLSSEPLNPWSPLEEPSKKNGFHGFCEGAWLVRVKGKEGLVIAQKPLGVTVTIPHWRCKKCQFQAPAPKDKKMLPRTIYTGPAGIKYRWIFLARSHLKSSDPTGKPDCYTYGCIFCAAEGRRETPAYGKLDLLIEHIGSKHGVQTMSAEVKEKTRCITGREAGNDEDWDINIPSGKPTQWSGFMRAR